MRWIRIQNIFINIKYEFKLQDPETMNFPHRLNATEVTLSECPLSSYMDFLDSYSHIRTELSSNMRWIRIQNKFIIIKYDFKLLDPETIYFPHRLNATEVTIEECPLSSYMDFPDSFSHIRTELSSNMRWIRIQNIFINIKYEFKLQDPETMNVPHRLNATEVTDLECPLSYYMDFPDSYSHIRIDLSPDMRWIRIKNIINNIKYEFKLPDPEMMNFPHRLNATEVTIEECPLSYYMDFPDSFSHIRTELSSNMRWIRIQNIFINIKYEFKLQDPETIYFPDGLNATEDTQLECPLSSYMDF
jgi:tRNA threonylcarbamoyladenosine modification (KEOPS) complex  Pcc1 subunit